MCAQFVINKLLQLNHHQNILNYLCSMSNVSAESSINSESSMEQLLTNRLIGLISETNLARIRNKPQSSRAYKNQFHFICISGVPAFDKQFQNLDLPGDKTVFILSGVEKEYSHQQYIELFHRVTLESEADRVAQIVASVPKNKRIVMVYHSFGTFILGKYINKYGGSRIFGLVEISGMPVNVLRYKIRDPNIKQFRQIAEKVEEVHKDYVKFYTQNKMASLNNKYHMLMWLKVLEGQPVSEYTKSFPNILKLFFAAGKDAFYKQKDVNSKLAYYTYFKQLDQAQKLAVTKAYMKINGEKVRNVQQKFVINFEEGKHSLHMQSRMVPDIKLAIHQYLTVLDEASMNVQPRL